MTNKQAIGCYLLFIIMVLSIAGVFLMVDLISFLVLFGCFVIIAIIFTIIFGLIEGKL